MGPAEGDTGDPPDDARADGPAAPGRAGAAASKGSVTGRPGPGRPWDAPAWRPDLTKDTPRPAVELAAAAPVPSDHPDATPAGTDGTANRSSVAPAAPTGGVVPARSSAVPQPAGLHPVEGSAGPVVAAAQTGHRPSDATAGGGPPPGWRPGPVGPRRPHRWGLGAYLLVEVVFLGSSLMLGLMFAGGDQLSAGALALALSVPTALAAGLALVITLLRGNGPRIDLGLQWSWRDLGVGFAFGLGGLLVTIPASILYVAVVGQDTTTAVGEVFGDVRAGPLLAVTVLVIVVLLAPLCEEIVYRGLLWGGVERLGASRWVTFAVTTLLFALAHFEFTRTPLLLIVAIPIGLARLYTGRLLASIVAHQVNNLLPGVVLLLGLLGALPAV